MFLPQSCQTLFFSTFPIWFKMLGLTLIQKPRTAPSWLFWFFVTIWIFCFYPIFPHMLTHFRVHAVSALLNGKWGTSSYSFSCKIFLWDWHYLAVELWPKVAFNPLELCCSPWSSPLYTFVLWGEKGNCCYSLLLFFSSHVHLSTLVLCSWIFRNCCFP